ncbi:MAG: TMEM165/GDT1 family protein [Polyangiales bacterium]
MLRDALTVYGTVLLAELVGDKTFYSVGALATANRPAPVLLGASLGAACKMAAAVALGGLIARLPPALLAGVTAVTFFAMAASLARRPAAGSDSSARPRGAARSTLAAFGSIVLTEWGDVGQVAVAVLAARYRPAALVWAAASLAMITKVAVGLAVGAAVRRRLPERAVRGVAVALCVAMGVLSAFRVEL